MDRLSIVLILIVGFTLPGGLIIAVLALGWYSGLAIGRAAATGLVLSWPTGYLISRRIKRQDPGRDETRVAELDGLVPDTSAKEV